MTDTANPSSSTAAESTDSARYYVGYSWDHPMERDCDGTTTYEEFETETAAKAAAHLMATRWGSNLDVYKLERIYQVKKL